MDGWVLAGLPRRSPPPRNDPRRQPTATVAFPWLAVLIRNGMEWNFANTERKWCDFRGAVFERTKGSRYGLYIEEGNDGRLEVGQRNHPLKYSTSPLGLVLHSVQFLCQAKGRVEMDHVDGKRYSS